MKNYDNYNKSMIDLIRDKEYDIIEYKLKNNEVDINKVRGQYEYTFLYNAVLNNCCIELFLKYGANPNIPNFLGSTPIFYACKERLFDTIDLLIKYGAELNNTDKTFIPLFAIDSLFTNDISILKKLLDNGANINIKHKYGYNILTAYTLQHKYMDIYEVVAFLLSYENFDYLSVDDDGKNFYQYLNKQDQSLFAKDFPYQYNKIKISMKSSIFNL